MKAAPLLLAALILAFTITRSVAAGPMPAAVSALGVVAVAAPEPHGDEEHGDHHGDNSRAEALAVSEPPPWYGKVVTGFLVLFLLAVFVGSAAIIVRGPEPPDPADDHGHGHGDGHGHGHGHGHDHHH